MALSPNDGGNPEDLSRAEAKKGRNDAVGSLVLPMLLAAESRRSLPVCTLVMDMIAWCVFIFLAEWGGRLCPPYTIAEVYTHRLG